MVADFEDYEYSDGDNLCCPYCKHEFTYTGDSLYQDEETENVCPECDKEFVSVADYSRSFNNYKKESNDVSKQKEEWVLNFCPKCNQMTNHLKAGKCLKCKDVSLGADE